MKQRRRMVMVDDPLWKEAEGVASKIEVSRSALVRMGLRAVVGMMEGETPSLRLLMKAEGREPEEEEER